MRDEYFIPTEGNHRQRRQRNFFSYGEKVNFFIGLNTFRESNYIFRDIANCDALGFNNPDGTIRTNVNLKDLERTLLKHIRVCQRTDTVYWKESTPSECRARPDIINAPINNSPETVNPSHIFRPADQNTEGNEFESSRILQLVREQTLAMQRRMGTGTSTSRTVPSSEVRQVPSTSKRPEPVIYDLESATSDAEIGPSRKKLFTSPSPHQSPSSTQANRPPHEKDPVSLISSEEENEPELDAESEESLFDSFVNTEPATMTANEDRDHILSHMYRKYVASRSSRSGLELTNYSLDQPLTPSSSFPHSLADDHASSSYSLDQDPLFQLVQSTLHPCEEATVLQATAFHLETFHSFPHPNRRLPRLHLQFLFQMIRNKSN